MDPIDLTSRHYRAYTLDESEDAAARQFASRYGRPPELIVESHGLLFVGPIPEQPLQNLQQLAFEVG